MRIFLSFIGKFPLLSLLVGALLSGCASPNREPRPQATPITPIYDILSIYDLEKEGEVRTQSTPLGDIKYRPVWQCRKPDRLITRCVPTGHRRSELGGKFSYGIELHLESERQLFVFLIRSTLTRVGCQEMTKEWLALFHEGEPTCLAAESLDVESIEKLKTVGESTWLLSAIKSKRGHWTYFDQ